jgi:protein phosphatase
VGDSRGYLIRGNEIKQITKDQSLVQHLIDLNQLAEEEAERHPLGNVILQAMGTQSEVSPAQNRVRLMQRDILLLCSDGLSKMLRPHDMLEVITQNGVVLSTACANLVSEANGNGGEDNITAILARFDGDDLPLSNGVKIAIEMPNLEEDSTLSD